MIDTLSDVLRAVRLHGAVFFKVDATTPWAAEAPAGESVAAHIMPGVEHVIEYHVITRGSCWGGLVDEPAIRLEAGDVIVFPQGDAHVLSSDPGMRGRPDAAAFGAVKHSRVPVSLSINGGGSDGAQLVCGFLGCDARPFNPLLATLPRVIHLRATAGDSLPHLVELAVAESNQERAGGECVLSKLSELLFVEVVRRYRDPVYGKYVKRRKRFHAHDERNEFRTQDMVEIKESRPLSRTKRWVVTRLVERPEEA